MNQAYSKVRTERLQCARPVKRQRPYLGGPVDGSFVVHYDGSLRAVTVKLHCMELAELYCSRVADGGHTRTYVEPSRHEQK